MCILDDPILALIARFVVDDLDNLSVSDEVFLKSQVSAINAHIESAPEEQQQQLAMSWIKEHAEDYRTDWQKKALSRFVVDRRCLDCPLVHDNDNGFCTIHSRWIILLNDYVSNRIDSEKYIEETLNVLAQHKNKLKVSGYFQ